jgi:hypothetical protein
MKNEMMLLFEVNDDLPKEIKEKLASLEGSVGDGLIKVHFKHLPGTAIPIEVVATKTTGLSGNFIRATLLRTPLSREKTQHGYEQALGKLRGIAIPAIKPIILEQDVRVTLQFRIWFTETPEWHDSTLFQEDPFQIPKKVTVTVLYDEDKKSPLGIALDEPMEWVREKLLSILPQGFNREDLVIEESMPETMKDEVKINIEGFPTEETAREALEALLSFYQKSIAGFREDIRPKWLSVEVNYKPGGVQDRVFEKYREID